MTALPVAEPRATPRESAGPHYLSTDAVSSTAGMPMISLRALGKSFPIRRGWRQTLRHPKARESLPVLSNVNLDVRQGEFFGLLGPNGAGKSTLFRMLATLILPDSGDVLVNGLDVVREAEDVRRLVALAGTDERSLFWRATARDNLALYATLHGLRGKVAQQRVTDALETVELADTGERMVGQFSSGMKQRLMIARALIPGPRLLLLDEPTRSLDPISARRFRVFLRTELAERQRCTILLATHNPEEALDLCDRVAVLHRGQLLATGPADELMARYGEQRYRVGVPWAQLPLLLRALRAMEFTPTDIASPPLVNEGRRLAEVIFPGGELVSTSVIRKLLASDIDVLCFERVGLTLADLLERVVHGGGGPTDA